MKTSLLCKVRTSASRVAPHPAWLFISIGDQECVCLLHRKKPVCPEGTPGGQGPTCDEIEGTKNQYLEICVVRREQNIPVGLEILKTSTENEDKL